VFHVGYWKQDGLRYTGAIVRTNANLKFYGAGLFLGDALVNLNLNAWMLFQQLKGRMGESKLLIGGEYLLFDAIAYFPVSQRVFVGTRFLNN
jgi:hypothetical protein